MNKIKNGIETKKSQNVAPSTEQVRFECHLVERDVMAGETIMLECETSRPTPVQWLRDRELLTPDDRIEVCDSGMVHTLMVHEATEEDEAEYMCRIVENNKSTSAIIFVDG